jgi:hypothetical protein
MELIKIDRFELRIFLAGLSQITGEYEILKKFTPELKENGEPYSMYERHFSVYHALYMLKDEAGRSELYLHIDPLRIRLLPIPEAGFCGHYYPDKGSFCMKETGSLFCEKHCGDIAPEIPLFDPMAQFYLDPENIAFGESEILNEIMAGFRIYFIRKSEIDKALILFNINKPARKTISRDTGSLLPNFIRTEAEARRRR